MVQQREEVPRVDGTTLRLAQLTSNLVAPLGGAEQYFVRISLALKSAGFEVEVFTSAIDASTAKEFEQAEIPVRIINRWRPYTPGKRKPNKPAGLIFHFLDLIQSFPGMSKKVLDGFEIVHVHRFQGIGLSLLPKTNARVIFTTHDHALIDTATIGFREHRKSASGGLGRGQIARAWILCRIMKSRKAQILFPSQRVADRHLEIWGTNSPPFSVMPLGWLLEGLPSRPMLACKNVAFFYIGALTEEKGIGHILEQLGRDEVQFSLKVAGEGPLAEMARNTPNVDYMGWLGPTEKAAAFSNADCLVLTSRMEEVFSLVAVEAMLAGIPVICTQRNKPPYIKDGFNGVVLAEREPDFLKAMKELAKDSPKLVRLKRGALCTAPEFGMREHVSRLERFYASPGEGG